MRTDRAIATLLALSAFLAGSAFKEAWQAAGYPLAADRGAGDLLLSGWFLLLAWAIDRARTTQ